MSEIPVEQDGKLISEEDKAAQLAVAPDTVIDSDKAYDMAHAAKELRDRSADNRKVAKNITAAILDLPKIAEELDQPIRESISVTEQTIKDIQPLLKVRGNYREEPASQEEADARQEIQQLEDTGAKAEKLQKKAIDEIIEAQIPEIRDVLYGVAYAIIEEAKHGIWTAYERHYGQKDTPRKDLDKVTNEIADRATGALEDRAELHGLIGGERIEAEKLEEWAGILHDNPPSEDYKELHGDLGDFTPEYLVELEFEVIKRNKDLRNFELVMDRFLDHDDEWHRNRIKRVLGPDYAHSNDKIVPLMEGANTSRDRETGVRFYSNDVERLLDMDGGDLTAGKMSDANIAKLAYRKGSPELEKFNNRDNLSDDEKISIYIDALRRAVKVLTTPHRLKKAMLEEIRSGRAAQWRKI